jgi:tetratricopeptide (TPR) repeat protein
LELEEPTIVEGRCLARLERFDELATLIRDYHAEHGETSDTLFLEGVAARGAKDVRRAAGLFRRALEKDVAAGHAAPLPEVAGPGLPNMLGVAQIDLAEFEVARAAFDTALQREPGNIEAELGRVAARFGQGELEEVLHDLDRLVEQHGTDPKVWIAGGILLGQIPQLAPANVGWLEEAGQRFPDHEELCRRLGEARLSCGNPEEAIAAWSRLGQDRPDLASARVAASLAGGGEMPDVAQASREAVGVEVLAWFQRWAACGAWQALDRALLEIGRAESLLPGLAESTAVWLERGGQQEAADNVRARGGETA